MKFGPIRLGVYAVIGGAAAIAYGQSQDALQVSQPPPSPELGESPAPALLRSLFNWGPVSLRPPTVNYTFSSSTGAQIQPGVSQDTLIQTFGAGLGLGIGSHWSLSYSPALIFYSNDRYSDSFNHSLLLAGQTTYEDWSFAVSQSYAPGSQVLVETATQTDTQTFVTTLGASHQMSQKSSMNLSLMQSFRLADEFNSSRDWVFSPGYSYQLFPSVSLGLGLSVGYSDVSQGSDMVFEQLNGSVGWKVTDKISASVSAGGEVRQFLDVESKSLFNPTFAASIGYQPFEPTLFSLSASRGVQASYFADQVTETTSVNVGVRQRLLKHFHLGLSGGFHSSSYVAADSSLDETRSDDGFDFGASFGFGFLKRANFSAFYSMSENSSSESDFTFTSTQVGFSLGYAF